jgi:type VI secretion system protein ImpF
MFTDDVQFTELPSFLDRLLDDEPDWEFDRFTIATIDNLLERLQRDIAAMLRMRRSFDEITLEGAHLNGTLLDLGLPSISVFDLSMASDRDSLRRQVQVLLKRHEPRLIETSVSLARHGGHRLKLSIRGRLRLPMRTLPITLAVTMAETGEPVEVESMSDRAAR